MPVDVEAALAPPSGGLALAAPVTRLRGVGDKAAEHLAKLGIRTVADVLFHLPARYQDRTCVQPIGALRAGEEAVVQGTVLLTEVRYGRRPMLLSRVGDGTGQITLRFFHFSAAQREGLAPGVGLRCFGEVRRAAGALEMVHPEYQRLGAERSAPARQGLTPVYPAGAGVRQALLRSLAQQALASLAGGDLQELLPEEVRLRHRLAGFAEALRYLHAPPPGAPVAELVERRDPMCKRLAFEELLAHQLSYRQLRDTVKRRPAPVLAPPGELLRRLLARLPFALTAAQQRVVAEVAEDLRKDVPMQRLVQGDVGSGKTIVAVAAVLQAVEAGRQAAVMVPTELLAEQHYMNFSTWLEPLGIRTAWLSGRLKGAVRRELLHGLRRGDCAVVVGTHALFQEDVEFAALGLVVIDEQHRFGVHQRLALREKGRGAGLYPHQLIMTATPIPRTLAMTAYADLDCSVIDALPPGRQPVDTVVVPDARRAEVLERVSRAAAAGRQIYWVCTLIEESELLQCQAAVETAARLGAALPGLRIGLVHGRQGARERQEVMAAFKQGALDLLVATTVIEVGVDVPNASLMIIENAERLGLAQLHQLRGRVGRGAARSACVLLYRGPLPRRGKARLAALRGCNDGFEIARRDLELRGPGEVLGTRQAGVAELRVADLLRDQALIPQVARCAALIMERYPERIAPLVRRWLADAPKYGAV